MKNSVNCDYALLETHTLVEAERYRARQYNPRYVHFAAATGMTMEERLAANRERWPGGPAYGFQAFIAAASDLFVEEVLKPEAPATRGLLSYEWRRLPACDVRWDGFIAANRVRIAEKAGLL